jgi:hypothetical protein
MNDMKLFNAVSATKSVNVIVLLNLVTLIKEHISFLTDYIQAGENLGITKQNKMKQQNNNYVIILLFLCGLCLFSCKYNTKENRIFPKEKELFLSNMNAMENMGEVVNIKSVGDFLVVTGRNMETQVLLIDKKNKESYMFGETGEGPDNFCELPNIMPIDNKRIGIYDLQKRLIYNFNIDSILRGDKHYMPDILRFKRFKCVLKLRFLRSIFHLLSFPIRCISGGMGFEYELQLYV